MVNDGEHPLQRVGYILDLVKPGMNVKFVDGQYRIEMRTADPDVVKAMAEEFLCREVGARR